MKKFTLFLPVTFVLLLGSSGVFAQAEYTPNTQHSETAPFDYMEATWDILFSYNTVLGGEQGIATDGMYYYTSKWNTTSNAYVNKYNTAGVKVDSFMVGAACPGIRDFAYDGQFYYGGKNAAQLYKMDFTAHTLVSTINTGITSIRHCAYDPTANSNAGGFWAGAWNSLQLMSMTGSVLATVSPFSLTSVYGSAYDAVTPGGPYLWLGDQNGSSTTTPMPQFIHQFSIPNMTLTGVSHDLSDVPDYVLGDIIGGLESSSTLFMGKFVLVGNMQRSPNKVFIYEMVTTDVNTNEVHTVVNVYPNPARDYIKVSSSIYPILDLTIHNQIGQLVYQNLSGAVEARVNTADFESGVYYVRVQTKDGISTHKLVID